MRVVLFAGAHCHDDPLFRYIYAWVRSRHPEVRVVRVERRGHEGGVRRWARKVRVAGLAHTLLLAATMPVQRRIFGRDAALSGAAIDRLPRPSPQTPMPGDIIVSTVNGLDAVAALRSLEPDVVIQAGAGILRRQVFTIARIGTLNLHHGIAPLIRGVGSLYWALHERRPEWVGATIHRIDDGIDTGDVLAYAPVELGDDDSFPALFARVTEAGVTALLEVLERLDRGERWRVPAVSGDGHYRSTMDGCRLLCLEWRRRRALGRAHGSSGTTRRAAR